MDDIDILKIEIASLKDAEIKLKEVLADIADIEELDLLYYIIDFATNNTISDLKMEKEIELESKKNV